MKKLFNTLVNNTQEFSFSQQDLDHIDVVDQGENDYHLIEDRHAATAHVVRADFNRRTYSIRINSNMYEVSIQRHIDLLISKMGYTNGSSKVANSIEAPMPGVIIGIEVKKGQSVQEGDCLIILEAMKMENTIVSPKAAVIKNIYVAPGDTVDKNKLLIDFE